MIEYNKNSNFPQNLAQNDARRLVPDLFLFFRKALYEAKAIGLQLSFKYISRVPNLANNTNKLYKTLGY